MRDNLRIIGAIVAKDMVDGLKNKTTLSVLLSILFIVAFYRVMPALTGREEVPNVLVYDAGHSSLVTALENSSAVKQYTYPSQEKMEHTLANGDVPELGLVIPADFDQVVAAGNSPELQGYVMHWVSQADAAELKQYVEAHVTELAGVPVHIQMDGNVVYMWPDSTGAGLLTTLAMVIVIVMVGITFVPHMMIEEKRARTLDALLVSPAGPVQVTIAKALTGLFYCVLGMGIVLVLNYNLIIQWWLAILATMCGSLFAVALGLLLGTLIETRQQFTLWSWVLIVPLLIPTFLSIMTDLLPGWLLGVFQWIPSVALFRVLRVSTSNQAQFGLYGPRLALMLAYAVLVLALVAWRIRRADR